MTNSKWYEIGILPECNKLALEQLLNKLIKKWWKPWWLNPVWEITIDYDIVFAFDAFDSLQKWHYSFRELTSKESGLWQFVCENKLIRFHRWDRAKNVSIVWEYPTLDCDINYWPIDYEYRLIESALIDEDKLWKFLLENIKSWED